MSSAVVLPVTTFAVLSASSIQRADQLSRLL
jgi:hypothetical protein